MENTFLLLFIFKKNCPVWKLFLIIGILIQHLKPKRLFVRGFTLLELLIVIAVIFMLISILVPALNKTKLKARTIVCAGNLNQLGKTILLYSNDYNDYPPLYYYMQSGKAILWSDTLINESYLPNSKEYPYPSNVARPLPSGILKCPEDKSEFTDWDTWRGTMYTLNRCYYMDVSGNPVRLKLSNCPKPSDYMLLVDKARQKGWTTAYQRDDNITSYRHSTKVNNLFLDNHVETLSISQMGTAFQRPYFLLGTGSPNYDK